MKPELKHQDPICMRNIDNYYKECLKCHFDPQTQPRYISR